MIVKNRISEEDLRNIVYIINNNIFKFDEVYYLKHQDLENQEFDFLYRIQKFFPIIDEFWDLHSYFLPLINNQVNNFINYKKLVLFDEGIETYLSLYSHTIQPNKVLLLFPEILSPMDKLKYPIQEISLGIYKHNLNQISQLLSIKKEHIEENAILFISSLFWDANIENNKIGYEIELINTLINDYNYHIYYKKHPRNNDSEVRRVLDGIINKDMFHIIDFIYSIEIYLVNHKFKAILSYYSTVLFSAFKTFRIPTFTYTHRDLLREWNFALKTFINLYIPNIKDYLNNQNNYTLEEYYNKFQQNVQQQLACRSFFELVKEKQILFMVQERITFLENKNNEIIGILNNNHDLNLEQINQLKGNFTRYKNKRLTKRLQKVGINSLVAFIPKRALRVEIREKLLQKIYTR